MQQRRMEATTILTIETRIAELIQLQDGWLDGKGRAPDRAALLRLAQAFAAHYSPDLPLPRLYPTAEGGVQAEWSQNGWEVSLEITLPAMTAEYQALHLRTGEIRELGLSLADDAEAAGWRALNAALKALRGTPAWRKAPCCCAKVCRPSFPPDDMSPIKPGRTEPGFIKESDPD
ncbi:hypothetical protein D8B22_05215 [Verminephrobacter aporrectodeae subsp. tuberculatae]|nr:hypothetical protein [Verminephrobacter aporrectodeae subsp. tuberculatae]MCW8168529.1 hypothetical protein [Verminephrobacter aporrectodeae subsp. tuberculatae]